MCAAAVRSLSGLEYPLSAVFNYALFASGGTR